MSNIPAFYLNCPSPALLFELDIAVHPRCSWMTPIQEDLLLLFSFPTSLTSLLKNNVHSMKCTLMIQRCPKFAGLSNLDPNIAKQRTSISTPTPWTLWTAISPKWNVCPMVVGAWLLCLACLWGSPMVWHPSYLWAPALLAPNPLQGVRTIWFMWPSCFI